MRNAARTVLRSFSCLLLIAAMACTASGSPGIESSAPELIELNTRLFERLLLHHDPEPYRTSAFPEYLFIANIGIIENLEEVTTTLHNLSIDALSLEHEELLFRGATAVLIGTMHVRGSVLGFPLPAQMRYMSVFVRERGAWRLLAQSLTEIDDPRRSP